MAKAQAAMEFLMTYGWAILVVLIAIGALAYFGVLSPARFLPENCIIDVNHGLYCEEFTADDLNDITLRIKNVFDKAATITRIDVEINGVVCSNLDEGIIEGRASSNFIVGTGCDLQAGERIKGIISISYEREGTALQRTASGTLTLYVAGAGGEAAGPDQGVCQTAEEEGLCEGLDLVFGLGYQDLCCEELGLCC